MKRQEIVAELKRLIEKARYVYSDEPVIGSTKAFAELLDATIAELESSFDSIGGGYEHQHTTLSGYEFKHTLSLEVLAECIKTALENPTTEARVLMGRLLTELERRTT